jgi:hypothetical protein
MYLLVIQMVSILATKMYDMPAILLALGVHPTLLWLMPETNAMKQNGYSQGADPSDVKQS